MKPARKKILKTASPKRFIARKKANRSIKGRSKRIEAFVTSFYTTYGEMMTKLSHE